VRVSVSKRSPTMPSRVISLPPKRGMVERGKVEIVKPRPSIPAHNSPLHPRGFSEVPRPGVVGRRGTSDIPRTMYNGYSYPLIPHRIPDSITTESSLK
jgi:hypothetical protein